MARLPVPQVLLKIIESGVLVLLVAALISYWWKISLHLMGIGGLSGFLLVSAAQSYFSALPLIMIVFIVAGLLSSARLKNGDHKPSQVYVGYLTGLAIVLVFFLI